MLETGAQVKRWKNVFQVNPRLNREGLILGAILNYTSVRVHIKAIKRTFNVSVLLGGTIIFKT